MWCHTLRGARQFGCNKLTDLSTYRPFYLKITKSEVHVKGTLYNFCNFWLVALLWSSIFMKGTLFSFTGDSKHIPANRFTLSWAGMCQQRLGTRRKISFANNKNSACDLKNMLTRFRWMSMSVKWNFEKLAKLTIYNTSCTLRQD